MSSRAKGTFRVGGWALLLALPACGVDEREVRSLDSLQTRDAGAARGGDDGARAASGSSAEGRGATDVVRTSAGGAPAAEQGGNPSIPLGGGAGAAGDEPAGSASMPSQADAGATMPRPEPEAQPEPGDATPPSVVSVTPAEGTSQVTSELISIRFSEPMNRASVEAGFSGGEAFVWSADSTSVTFRLPLPFAAEPRLFDIVVPAGVMDRAGNALGSPVETSIVLAALARALLPLDGALSGNQVAGQDGNFTFLEAGDTAGGLVHYGAASFGLTALPEFAAVRGLRQAVLHLQVSEVAGEPGDAAFDGVLIDRVSFGARADIDNPTIIEPAFARLLVPPAVAPGQIVRLDIATQLRAAWSASEEHIQFRFGPRASNLDAVADLVYLRRVADENNSVVDEAVVLEPDPDNAARIEVEYFP